MAAYFGQTEAYVDGQAPYIECLHGSSEVAQGFVRACCVHGGLVALNVPLRSVLRDPAGAVAGVRLYGGQVVRATRVVASAALMRGAEPGPDSSSDCAAATGPSARASGACANSAAQACTSPAVARQILVLDRPVIGEAEHVRIVVPPGIFGNVAAINVWQCCSALRVCAPGQAVLYLSTPVGAAELDGGLSACAAALTDPLQLAGAASMDSTSAKPRVLLSCAFRQAIHTDSTAFASNFVACSSVDAGVTMDQQADEAAVTFAALFPGEPFLVAEAQAVDVVPDALDAALLNLGVPAQDVD